MTDFTPAPVGAPTPSSVPSVGAEGADRPRSSILKALLVGFIAGLVVAALYAGLGIAVGAQIPEIAAVIGGTTGLFTAVVAGRTSVALGLAVAVVSTVQYLIAVFVQYAALAAREFRVGFFDMFAEMIRQPVDVLSVHFHNPLALGFAAFNAVVGYIFAAGVGKKAAR